VPFYQKADEYLVNLMNQVIGKFHERIRANDVSIELMIAFGRRDEDGLIVSPAIVVSGYQALAKVKITRGDERAAGRSDVVITLDGDHIGEKRPYDIPDGEIMAILDHELTHIEFRVDHKGIAETDDYGRPKMRLRKHDVQFGWFKEVADRWGAASQESKQAIHIAKFVQQQMKFVDALESA